MLSKEYPETHCFIGMVMEEKESGYTLQANLFCLLILLSSSSSTRLIISLIRRGGWDVAAGAQGPLSACGLTLNVKVV